MECDDDDHFSDLKEEPMDLELNDSIDFDEILGSNFAEMNFDEELTQNNEVFERMIFENDNPGDYNILEPEAAQEVMETAPSTHGKKIFQRLLVKILKFSFFSWIY